MHRAVPGAAEHPHPAESIPPGQSTPRGWPAPPAPTSHLAALVAPPVAHGRRCHGLHTFPQIDYPRFVVRHVRTSLASSLSAGLF